MMVKNKILPIDLQLFAEGGAGGDGGTGSAGMGVTGNAANSQSTGANGSDLSDVQYGIQDNGTPAAPAAEVQTEDAAARFEALIKGEFKDQFNAQVQDIVRKRLKSSQATVDKYTALAPTLELLAGKYGVKADDIEGLTKAINDDDTYFEDEALERGITVEQLKEIRRMERENADLKRQMSEQQTRENANKLYASWMDQEQQLKSIYPSFSLETEMQNPAFVDLLRANIPVRTAFEVLHKDEILPAAMQYTAQQIEQKVVNRVRANGARPMENGMQSQGAAVVKSDVSQLTKADRQEIIRRVARGEKIRF